MTNATTTIKITAALGHSQCDREEAKTIAQAVYERHAHGSDWICKVAAIDCAETAESDGDVWQVSTCVTVDGDEIGSDAGLEQAVADALNEALSVR